ncbi:MAG TPA: DinB family protein [Candidatus Acidoferrum sp.]|nr:DinB family protein [Candidatus Acidoferrum sp.]
MRKRSSLVLVAIALLVIGGASLPSGAQSQDQAPLPARSRAEETLQAWNEIGNKLVAMAEDFPEDKYDFKLQKDQRTFAQNLLHIAAVDYDLMRSASGSNIGPDFGKNKHNPSQEVYKTKADVVKLIQQAVADGAKLIEQQGDAGLDKTTKLPWANKLVHNSYTWTYAIEHSAEHYGQLVVYYRANNLVPPDSRRHAQQSQPLPAARVVDPKASDGTLLKASYFSAAAGVPPAQSSEQLPPTIASTVDRQISTIEKLIVEVAEAMPEEKFNFSPANLNIPGSDYNGVRTFALEVKHVAASNYFLWSPLTGEKLPEGQKDGNGPEVFKTKADIINFLKESFALGHRAAATLTSQDMLQTPEHSKSTRLHLATFGVAHAYDHYGQMVEYLRMNGIVPPASRGKSD